MQYTIYTKENIGVKGSVLKKDRLNKNKNKGN